MPQDLMDFYLLHHAFEDLRHDKVQWYWEGADRSNIAGIIDDHCRNWLKEQGLEA